MLSSSKARPEIADVILGPRDSMALTGEERLEIAARSDTDLLLVETAL